VGDLLLLSLALCPILTGWFTARSAPTLTIYGVMRTSDALTPHLGVGQTLTRCSSSGDLRPDLSFGTLYLPLLRAGPCAGHDSHRPSIPSDLALPGDDDLRKRCGHDPLLGLVLALTTLLYVLLDSASILVSAFCLLEPATKASAADDGGDFHRFWDVTKPGWCCGTVLFALPSVYATLLSAFYLPLTLMLEL